MKRIFTLSIIFCLSGLINGLYAQAPNWLWAEGTGLSGFQYGSTMYSSPSGDIYTSGRLTNGTSVLGGVNVTSSGTAGFMGRLHPSGSFVWANTYPVGTFDYLFAFYRDNSGTLYGCGTAQGGNSHYFWANRADSTGVQNWSYLNNDGPQPTAITADKWGDIYVAAAYNGSATFSGQTVTSVGGQNIFLLKFNVAGNLIWAKDIGGGGNNEQIRALHTDDAGNVYFIGGYTGTPDFGGKTLPATSGYSGLYVAKFDSAANAIFVSTADNAGPISNLDNAADLKLDACGNIYIACAFQGTTTFGSLSLTSNGGHDILVAKLLSNGQWEWVKNAGGAADREEGTGIALDKDFDVYVTGIFQNTATFGPYSITNPNTGHDGMFVAKYANSTGDIQWVQSSSCVGGGDENGSGIAVDNNKFTYVTGDFVGTSAFGTNSVVAPSNWPNNDIYIAGLDSGAQLHIAVTPSLAYCPGSAGQLTFSATGTFNGGNTFTAQLSDSNGSFINAINIGNTTNSNGTISVNIPGGTPVGSNYIIRVVSSSPAYSSFDYCQKLQIGSASVTVSADTTSCGGAPIQLNATGGSTYTWSPNAGLTCVTCSNPIATPTVTTTYSVNVSSGLCSKNDSVVITVAAAVNLVINPTGASICSGSSASLSVSGASTYAWSPGGTLTDSTSNNPAASPTVTTTYTIVGLNGVCSGTTQVVVQVGNVAVAGTITAARDTICSGSPGNLSLSGNSSNTIQWLSGTSVGNLTPLTGDTLASLLTNPLSQTTYFKAVVGSGACIDTTQIHTLFIPPPLTANFTKTNNTPTNVSFSSAPSIGNIISYFWAFGDGTTSTDPNPTHTYPRTDTTYNVCLTIYDGSNCSYTFCQDVPLTSTGIYQVTPGLNWNIYPDPFTNSITISVAGLNNETTLLQMVDVLGRIVLQKNVLINNSLSLNVASLTSSVYFVRLINGKNEYQQKVVKQ